MAAPKGNKFWLARSSHGRNPKFGSPDELWVACLEYFDWVEKNPLKEEKVFCFQGQITRTHVKKMRAMTQQGLLCFLDITKPTWAAYKSLDNYALMISRVEDIIYNQKFSGAAADLLNANIIARDLGLADKRQVEDVTPEKADREKRKSRIAELLSRGKRTD